MKKYLKNKFNFLIFITSFELVYLNVQKNTIRVIKKFEEFQIIDVHLIRENVIVFIDNLDQIYFFDLEKFSYLHPVS